MVAYLGLGSNLGDRQAEITAAVSALARAGRVAATSALYETDPEGGARQPCYVNAAVRLETSLSARALLKACLDIERARGRVRSSGACKGPRLIDIDVLLYGAEVIAEPGLRVPHPLLLMRPFVRIPLADVALPGLRHPGNGEGLDLCVPDATVRRID
ncbi:MAG: 2-amino-4-hydroxy-6-hydroxymethyldihydropteridine diphosphokinase [Deltaproteobacteria bacterium]|jgi:2-amino-4-hydroxy-6-hydroxymethyldihydropteridine diphosphokinase|nr:2-amino-4-hydroxy-6-hydroxymethyldihydropteridine diphosphokinase [Deltaproteobacteria bacterium]